MNTKIWTPLLLTESSPSFRFLFHKYILHSLDTLEEFQELATQRFDDSIITKILQFQNKDGSFRLPQGSNNEKHRIDNTAAMLYRLAYFELDKNHPSIQNAAQFLISSQNNDGSWSKTDSEDFLHYDWIPLQTAFPLRSLCACGIENSDTENAFSWLFQKALPEGAFPTGMIRGNLRPPAGYRKLPHSSLGCRTNTTLVVECASYCSKIKKNPVIQQAMDKLLALESLDRVPLGLEMARRIGVQPMNGHFTYFQEYDIALILELAARLGCSREDRRIQNLIQWLETQQSEFGIWSYLPSPHISRWLTFDLLRSLQNLTEISQWISLEPPTPFRKYSQKQKRF